jgi:CubicO group peptidase (beta-lactamase class C family)
MKRIDHQGAAPPLSRSDRSRSLKAADALALSPHCRAGHRPGQRWTLLLASPVAAAIGLLSLIYETPAQTPTSMASTATGSPMTPADLAPRLEPLRAEFKLPALAAAVVHKDAIVAWGAVGVRKHGGAEQVTPADKFHIGSCTKSMTAVLAAMFVERGQLAWSTTLEEVFPERAEQMNSAFRTVTLEQLLCHRSGAPESLDADGLWGRIWAHGGAPLEQRLFLLDGVTRQPPVAAPGTRFIYSNAGYAMAGAMIERVAGKPWEDLIREMLFAPLEMGTAGFGAPAAPGQVDQPWGHPAGLLGLKPVPPGPRADNPPAIAPAGTVHCSIGDLAKYAAFHLRGARGTARLLKAATFKKLHTPVAGQDYALGWLAVPREWAGGLALTHTGSNTMFFAVIWLAPAKDFGVVVATNLGGRRAEQGCDKTAWTLIQDYLLK